MPPTLLVCGKCFIKGTAATSNWSFALPLKILQSLVRCLATKYDVNGSNLSKNNCFSPSSCQVLIEGFQRIPN